MAATAGGAVEGVMVVLIEVGWGLAAAVRGLAAAARALAAVTGSGWGSDWTRRQSR